MNNLLYHTFTSYNSEYPVYDRIMSMPVFARKCAQPLEMLVSYLNDNVITAMLRYCTVIFFFQLEQAVVKEMAWFRDTALSLEKLKTINLDPELISEQLYEQKVRTLCTQ